ncbi:hypothetical protein [uncultured Desulfuromusa sp.]|uniref:hypothetical protein n=1 Tax=uncultured Desulfuromusa sp. TaxID=219183 RepID=UPI002AA70EDE|nr:hypothetical protein [uncultured Desulfuromusa sp.]
MDFEFEGAPNQPHQKSTFVNVLAWIFIIFGGFATFMSILQNIMIHTVFPKEEMNQAMQQAENVEQLPAFFGFMFNNFNLFFIFFFVVSLASFISAIALLKRKNWARIVFIVLMSVGIIWNIGGIILQFTMYNSMQEFSGGQAPPPEFESMMQIMKIASVIMVVAFSALFGFVIKKLCSQSIKAEFT